MLHGYGPGVAPAGLLTALPSKSASWTYHLYHRCHPELAFRTLLRDVFLVQQIAPITGTSQDSLGEAFSFQYT